MSVMTFSMSINIYLSNRLYIVGTHSNNVLTPKPLEVVSRYRDPQPQVVENCSYLFNLRRNLCNTRCVNIHLIPI